MAVMYVVVEETIIGNDYQSNILGVCPSIEIANALKNATEKQYEIECPIIEDVWDSDEEFIPIEDIVEFYDSCDRDIRIEETRFYNNISEID